MAVVCSRCDASSVDVGPGDVQVSHTRAPAGGVQQQPITAQLAAQAASHVQYLDVNQSTSVVIKDLIVKAKVFKARAAPVLKVKTQGHGVCRWRYLLTYLLTYRSMAAIK